MAPEAAGGFGFYAGVMARQKLFNAFRHVSRARFKINDEQGDDEAYVEVGARGRARDDDARAAQTARAFRASARARSGRDAAARRAETDVTRCRGTSEPSRMPSSRIL